MDVLHPCFQDESTASDVVLHPPLDQLQRELGSVTGELGAARARLEAAVAEKQVLEARLAEARRDLEEAQKQLTEKGWEAAEAAASTSREMAKQRSENEEKCKLLEKEQAALREKLQSAQSQLTQAESQQQLLELQVQTKDQQLLDLEERKEVTAQAQKLEDLERHAAQAMQRLESNSATLLPGERSDGGGGLCTDERQMSPCMMDEVQSELVQLKQQFQEVLVGLRTFQTEVQHSREASAAAEEDLQQSRSEVEATAQACVALKQQLTAVNDHFAKQRLEIATVRRVPDKFETRMTADGRKVEAEFVPYSADVGLEQGLPASESTSGRRVSQLQRELGSVTGELGAARARLEAAVAEKQVLEARLAEARRDLEEAQKQLTEKGWEAAEAAASTSREMAKQRSENEEKCKLLEKEQAALREKLQSAQSQLTQAESQKQLLELQVQTKDQQLLDLEERKVQEVTAQALKLEELQAEVGRLVAEWSKASHSSQVLSEPSELARELVREVQRLSLGKEGGANDHLDASKEEIAAEDCQKTQGPGCFLAQ